VGRVLSTAGVAGDEGESAARRLYPARLIPSRTVFAQPRRPKSKPGIGDAASYRRTRHGRGKRKFRSGAYCGRIGL
jgi:hypothetical protein